MTSVDKKMRKTPEEKLIIRKILFGFGAGLFFIAVIVTAGLLFIVHRTHSYLEELNQYPQNYVVFYQGDNFRIPQKNVISKDDFKRFLILQGKLETIVEGLIRSGKISENPPETAQLKQLAIIRNAEMSLFKRENYSIRKYKWIAQQILLAFGGSHLRKFQRLSASAPMNVSPNNVEQAISKIPEENLALFDQYSKKIASFHFLWLTAI